MNNIKTLSTYYPLHDLFSPTALDNDLTYVDKTYYNGAILNNSKSNHEKQSNSVHSIVLNRTISLVTSISRLDLRNIGLFVLPTQVSLLTRLTLLDLSHNKLVKLPSSLDQLKHLKHLNISHNRLTQLPSSIYSLCKLNHLDMSYNPFNRVSANLARLIQLILLDLSNTEIIFIPAELLSLTMTTIRFENCNKLKEELNQKLQHNPISLIENCARQIIQPILFNLIKNKKKKKQEILFDKLPKHIINYLSKPKACSTCGGPYFKSFVSRYRIIQRQDDNWIPIEYKLCSAHWNNENDRILSLFSKSPNSFLPTTTEPCHLKLL